MFKKRYLNISAFSLVELLIALVSFSMLTVGAYRAVMNQQRGTSAQVVKSAPYIMNAQRALQQMKEKIESVNFNPTLTTPFCSIKHDWLSATTEQQQRMIGPIIANSHMFYFANDRVDENGVIGNYDGKINLANKSYNPRQSLASTEENSWSGYIDDLEQTRYQINWSFSTFDAEEKSVPFGRSKRPIAIWQAKTYQRGATTALSKDKVVIDNLAYAKFFYFGRDTFPVFGTSPFNLHYTLCNQCEMGGVVLIILLRSPAPIPGYTNTGVDDLTQPLAGGTSADYLFGHTGDKIKRTGGDYQYTMLTMTAFFKNACVPPKAEAVTGS